MSVLWLVLLAATGVHEGAHGLLLWRDGARPRLVVRWCGVGWKFDPHSLPVGRLVTAWNAGPMAEACVWAGAAAVLPGLRLLCLGLGAMELAIQLWLPGSDGARVRRWMRQEGS